MKAAKGLYEVIRQLLFGFVRYRIHLSIIFAFLLYNNNLRTGAPINYWLLGSFTLWHFSLFLFDRIFDRKLDALSQPDEFVQENHARWLYTVVAACLTASFGFFVLSGSSAIYWLLLLPVTFLYTVPVYKQTRAKNIFLLKNLYSAVLIYGLPLLLHGYLLSHQQPAYVHLQPVISLMIYVLIGEIFWDIRDTSVDQMHHIATLPNVFGLLPTKIMMLLLIAADAAMVSFRFPESAFIYLFLLLFVHEKSDRLIFHLPPLIALMRFCL